MNLLQHIAHNLPKLGDELTLQEKSLHTRIEHYVLLIEKWNKIHNLTAIRNPQDMLFQHVMDSLAVVRHIHGPQIIDVGSGAGLPGIPIALARPDWQVLLVESNRKKASFLQQAKIELALQNVEILAERIEDIRLNKKIDTIITRAFSELGEFVQLTKRLIRDDNMSCRWVAMKANCSDTELQQIQAPFVTEKIVTLTVPGLDADRQLIIMRKQSSE